MLPPVRTMLGYLLSEQEKLSTVDRVAKVNSNATGTRGPMLVLSLPL